MSLKLRISILFVSVALFIAYLFLSSPDLRKLNDLSKDKKSIKNFSEHISLFVRIVESYSSGKYTYVPWKSIALIVAGILYFIYPVDLIPDFIPISGIIDDVALIAWIYKSVDEDIQKFLEWEKSHKS